MCDPWMSPIISGCDETPQNLSAGALALNTAATVTELMRPVTTKRATGQRAKPESKGGADNVVFVCSSWEIRQRMLKLFSRTEHLVHVYSHHDQIIH